MTKQSPLTRLVAAALCTIFLAAPAFAAKPGSGGSTTGSSVKYYVHFFDVPPDLDISGQVFPRGMNDQGQVVGGYEVNDWNKGFFYDFVSDVAVPLVDIIAPDDLPSGWEIRSATAVNNGGVIVGFLAKPGESYSVASMPFTIFPSADTQPWRLVVLPYGPVPGAPEDSPWHTFYPLGINEQNDVLVEYKYDTATGVATGSYVINAFEYWAGLTEGIELPPYIIPEGYAAKALNSELDLRAPQIVGITSAGYAFRQTGYGGSWAPQEFSFTPYWLGGINDGGTFCGSVLVKNHYKAFRHDGLSLTTFSFSGATRINEAGDMTSVSNVPALYHQGTGLIDLTSVITGEPEDVAVWNDNYYQSAGGPLNLAERGTLNPDMPNYPAIGGCLGIDSTASKPYYHYQPYILRPVTP